MSTKVLALAGLLILCSVPVGAADGVIMKDGKMMMMKDGKATEPMPSDMPMSDGTMVTPSGVVKMKSGEEKQLQNGEMMLMNGHIMKGGKATPMQPEE
jgi:hypothetical protein